MEPYKRKLERRISAASFGAFVFWVGICLVAEVGWGVGLLGVAAIILATQLLRAAGDLAVEWFWCALGGLFGIAAVSHLFDAPIDIGPIALMVAGAAILLSALLGHKYRPD